LINNNIHKGDFVLGKDFKPNIRKIEDEKVVKSIASQLFEVCIHRVKENLNQYTQKIILIFLKILKVGLK